jgi:SAM-dependent methyltransferase
MNTGPGNAAEFYERLWNQPAWHGAEANDHELRRARIIACWLGRLQDAHDGRPLRILDLGCGRGWLYPHLRPYGAVTGVEPVVAATELARRHFPDGEFVTGTGRTLIEEGRCGEFDAIVSTEVIEHVEDHASFLREAALLLAPGGMMILTTPRGELYRLYCRVIPREQQQPVENWLTRRDLGALCERVGFRIAAEERIYEIFSHEGRWRILNSPRFAALCQRIGPAGRVWRWWRQRYAIGYCCLLERVSVQYSSQS